MLMQKHAFLMSVLLPLRLDLGLPPDMQNNSNTICFLFGYLPHQLWRYRATASIFVLHVVPRSMDGFTILQNVTHCGYCCCCCCCALDNALAARGVMIGLNWSSSSSTLASTLAITATTKTSKSSRLR